MASSIRPKEKLDTIYMYTFIKKTEPPQEIILQSLEPPEMFHKNMRFQLVEHDPNGPKFNVDARIVKTITIPPRGSEQVEIHFPVKSAASKQVLHEDPPSLIRIHPQRIYINGKGTDLMIKQATNWHAFSFGSVNITILNTGYEEKRLKRNLLIPISNQIDTAHMTRDVLAELQDLDLSEEAFVSVDMGLNTAKGGPMEETIELSSLTLLHSRSHIVTPVQYKHKKTVKITKGYKMRLEEVD